MKNFYENEIRIYPSVISTKLLFENNNFWLPKCILLYFSQTYPNTKILIQKNQNPRYACGFQHVQHRIQISWFRGSLPTYNTQTRKSKEIKTQKSQYLLILTFYEPFKLAALAPISCTKCKIQPKCTFKSDHLNKKMETEYPICIKLFFTKSLEMIFSQAPKIMFYIYPPDCNLGNRMTHLSEETCPRLSLLTTKGITKLTFWIWRGIILQD